MHELHVDSIRKSYGYHCLLTNIFICCKPGDRIGLLGRNGRGKSTLMEIIFGTVQADNRFVRLNNVVTQGLVDQKRKISYLPQQNFLPSHLRIEKILNLICCDPFIPILKENPHIKPFLNRKSKSLSIGQRRMIEILIIINSPAEFVLLDEPFNGLEPIQKDHVKHLLKNRCAGKGVIITDHDYKNVLELSTKIILLSDGRTKNIIDKKDLIRAGYLPKA